MPADTAHNDQLRSFVLNSNETEIEKNLRSIGESIGLYGESETIRTIIRDVCRVAPSDVAVLVIGESGTGKDVVAKAIHQLSARRNKPLVIVNSGAIAEGILESELFGHERGAFTGAVSERKGYFETANGGTIFLDEIGDMPLQTQVKLLRVLETGEFLKVGGSVVRRCDVRVIGATNRNLEQMVRRGEFRKDLYYRLKAITITMPPLRQRRADIPVLIKRFTDEYSAQTYAKFRGFTAEAMDMMVNYRWPGNVRELKNFVESLITIKRGETVTADDITKQLENFKGIDAFENDADDTMLPIPTHMTPEQAERELLYRTLLSLKRDVDDIKHFLVAKFGNVPRPLGGSDFPHAGYAPHFDKETRDGKIVETEVYNVDEGQERDSLSLSDLERDMIIKALKKFDGKRNAAARSLGLSERTLYRKIKEYNLDL